MKRVPDPPEPTACIACGRRRWKGPVMSTQHIAGLSELVALCDDRKDCEAHEPPDTYPYIRVGP